MNCPSGAGDSRNHVYAGLVTHDSRLRQGCHPALIDREAYDDVQS